VTNIGNNYRLSACGAFSDIEPSSPDVRLTSQTEHQAPFPAPRIIGSLAMLLAILCLNSGDSLDDKVIGLRLPPPWLQCKMYPLTNRAPKSHSAAMTTKPTRINNRLRQCGQFKPVRSRDDMALIRN
jgi:hypothetical protein